MINLLLIVGNERERQILKAGFEHTGINLVVSTPTYANYLKAIQYCPDFILIELPRVCMDELHFASLIRKHRTTRKTCIMGYGETIAESILRGMSEKGVNHYFPRPLKFSAIITLIQKIAKTYNKSIDAKSTLSDKEADLALISDPQTLPEKKIDLIVKHVSKLLAFPFTVAKVMQLTESETSSAADLAKVIEADPIITTSILKVSNTVFFATAHRKINSIKDAIIRIGFRETKRLVTGMSVMKLFSSDTNSMGFDRSSFWYHSLATGVFAENTARRMGSISVEEAYLAGLLHDFGIIILDEFFPTIFKASLEKATDTGISFIDAEIGLFGIHHNDIIKRLFEEWKLPSPLIEGIYNQYTIQSYQDHFDTNGKRYALCVHLSDTLVKTMALGSECDQVVGRIEPWKFQESKLTSGFGKDFIDASMHELNLFKQLLRLDDKGAGPDQKQNLDEALAIGVFNSGFSLHNAPLVYLATCGMNTTALAHTTSHSEYDSLYDCIIITIFDEVSSDVIMPFTATIAKGAKASDSDESMHVPLIIITSEESSLKSAPFLAKARFLPPQYDLRQLENLVLTLTGKE